MTADRTSLLRIGDARWVIVLDSRATSLRDCQMIFTGHRTGQCGTDAPDTSDKCVVFRHTRCFPSGSGYRPQSKRCRLINAVSLSDRTAAPGPRGAELPDQLRRHRGQRGRHHRRRQGRHSGRSSGRISRRSCSSACTLSGTRWKRTWRCEEGGSSPTNGSTRTGGRGLPDNQLIGVPTTARSPQLFRPVA